MNDSEFTIAPEFPKVSGDFSGHAFPGTTFFLLGFWWSIKSIMKYVYKNQKKTCYLGFKAFLHQAEILEGISLICLVLIGIICTQIYGKRAELTIHEQGQHIRNMRFHHLTMYFLFGLLGVVNILRFTVGSLPVSLVKFVVFNAFFVEAFIIYNHTHGREMLDIFVHQLLGLTAFLGGLVTFMEFLTRNNVLLELLRSNLVMLQGTWLWQMGFVLYPVGGPVWDLMDHNNKMFLTVCFCWHYITGYILIGASYAVVTRLVKWRLARLCTTEFTPLKNAEKEQEPEEEI